MVLSVSKGKLALLWLFTRDVNAPHSGDAIAANREHQSSIFRLAIRYAIRTVSNDPARHGVASGSARAHAKWPGRTTRVEPLAERSALA